VATIAVAIGAVALAAVYDAIGKDWPGTWPPPPSEEIPDKRVDIEGSGLFDGGRVSATCGMRPTPPRERFRS